MLFLHYKEPVMKTDQEIKKMIGDFVRGVEPNAKVLLYGSRARGDNRPESDWDVAIILDNGRTRFDNTKRLTYPLFTMGATLGAEINATVYTPKQWQQGRGISNFYLNVEKEGQHI